MLPVLREDFHGYPMIGGNGSLISKQGKIVKSIAFSDEVLYKIKGVFGLLCGIKIYLYVLKQIKGLIHQTDHLVA